MPLPGYEAQRVEGMQWAYGTKRQKDYITPLLQADITLTHPIRELSVAEITKELRSDKAQYGKGHEWATYADEVARDVRFSRTFDGSSAILGWCFAFAMGKVATTQPDSVGSPTVFHHAFTFFDPLTETTSSVPVTTAVEHVTGGIKRYLESLAVTSLSISAEGFEHLVATIEMIGSGKTTTSAMTIPTMPTDLAFLTSQNATIKLGDSSEDITTRIRSWNLAIGNNLREARGYFPSSGVNRGRMEIGNRTISPSLVVDLDAGSDMLTDFLAGTEVALEIYCQGAIAEDTYYHYLRVRFPSLILRAVPIEENDGVWTYNITFDEETVLYRSGDTPAPICYVEVRNTTPTYLVAAT